MEVTLLIIVSLALFSQYILDFLLKSKRAKKIIGTIILILGLIAVLITYFSQEKDNIAHTKEINYQKERFNKLDSINTVLNTELKLRNEDLRIIRQQNDSLKIQLFELNEKQDKFITISEISIREVSKSRIALENMGLKQISRGISQYDKIQMVNILKKFKTSKIRLATPNGDLEALQFTYQIKEVFESAGWKVEDIAQVIFKRPVTGIFIKIKSTNYPPRVNGIFDAFKILNFIASGEINPNLGEDDVELIIGAK